MWGPDTPQRLAAAQGLVNEVELRSPGLKAWLEETGLGNSFEIIMMIADAAQRRTKAKREGDCQEEAHRAAQSAAGRLLARVPANEKRDRSRNQGGIFPEDRLFSRT